MSNLSREINNIKNPFHKALAWFFLGGLACVLGVTPWIMVVLAFGAGALVNLHFGLNLPAWTYWFALLGLPVGAWLEVRLSST